MFDSSLVSLQDLYIWWMVQSWRTRIKRIEIWSDVFMPVGDIVVRCLMATTQRTFCSGQHCSLLQFNRGGEETARYPKVSISIVNGERMVPEEDKSEQESWAITDSSSHLWRGIFRCVDHTWSLISLPGFLSYRCLKKDVNNLLKQLFFY